MARTKTATPAAKKRTAKKAKKDAPAPEKLPKKEKAAPDYAEQEKAIASKYGIEVKAGSLRYDETLKKRVLTIYCWSCKKPRQIATQDAFQVRTCGESECRKAHKQANG